MSGLTTSQPPLQRMPVLLDVSQKQSRINLEMPLNKLTEEEEGPGLLLWMLANIFGPY